MIVLNATNETHSVMAFGNYFTLPPKKFKVFHDTVGNFIVTEKGYLGFVSLPEEFEDPSYITKEEGKAAYEAAEKNGIENYVRHLKQIVYNNQVSLKRDLEMKNIKMDPRGLATDGELAAMEKLAVYMDTETAAQAKKIQRIKELEQKIGKIEK